MEMHFSLLFVRFPFSELKMIIIFSFGIKFNVSFISLFYGENMIRTLGEEISSIFIKCGISKSIIKIPRNQQFYVIIKKWKYNLLRRLNISLEVEMK